MPKKTRALTGPNAEQLVAHGWKQRLCFATEMEPYPRCPCRGERRESGLDFRLPTWDKGLMTKIIGKSPQAVSGDQIHPRLTRELPNVRENGDLSNSANWREEIGKYRPQYWITDPRNGQMKTGFRPFAQSSLLFFGSFLFAANMNFAFHELGHWIADRLYAIKDVRIFLHPFLGCRIIGFQWHGPKPWPWILDASGALLAVLVGASITFLLWRKRHPCLLPLLTIGPLACIMEGFGNAMGLLFNNPGTDPVNMVAAGIPYALLLGMFVFLFICGLMSFLLLFPLLGISDEDTIWRKLAILAGGPLSVTIGLMYVALVHPQEIKTSVMRLAFAIILISLLLALDKPLRPYLRRISKTQIAVVRWPASLMAISLGVLIVAIFLIFFN